MNNNKPLELNDFYSAAYLIAAGFKLLDVYRVGFQSTFVFEDSDAVKDHLGKYYAMQASVNAAAYAQEIKKLKSVIHTNSKSKPEVTSYGKGANM